MGGGKNGHEGIKQKEFISRKSPRIPVRKVKEKRMENKSTNRSEPRVSRKRKQGSYEDDPSYSEGEDGDANNDHQKKVPGYRCSPHLIPELMEQLCPKQLEWVEKIGFIALKDMIGSRSPKSLTMWLVEQVDTTNGTINVCGKPVDIRKGVKSLLQLPSGDKKVPQPLNGRAKAKIQKAGASRADDKHSDHGRGQSAKEAMKILLAEKQDEVAFCQSFVMLVLCIYLAPTTSLNINRSYFPALMDVSQISLLDWCGFIGDYLVNGIEEFRKSKASHVQVPGCVHLLPLLYLDALLKGKALVLPEALRLPEGEPRIHYITSEHLAFLASADIKSKSKDCVEYGLLQESIIGSKEVDGSTSSSGPTNREVGKDSSFKPRPWVENMNWAEDITYSPMKKIQLSKGGMAKNPWFYGVAREDVGTEVIETLFNWLGVTTHKQLDSWWIIHATPTMKKMSGNDFKSVFTRGYNFPEDLFDLAIRRFGQTDREMYGDGKKQRWMHPFESDFARKVINGEDYLNSRSIRMQLTSQEGEYDISNCRMVAVPHISLDTWTAYLWDMKERLVHVVDPTFENSRARELRGFHDPIVDKLQAAMKESFQNAFDGWEIDWASWNKNYIQPFLPGKSRNESGMLTLLALRKFNGIRFEVPQAEEQLMKFTRELLYDMLNIEGNQGILPDVFIQLMG